MWRALNFFLSLGVDANHSSEDRTLMKMVNFTALFAMVVSFSFFFASLRLDSKILTYSLLSYPALYILVLVVQAKKWPILARNLLYFGICGEIVTFAFIENPSSFTINYFFGIGMLTFVVYRTRLGQAVAFAFAMLCYFSINHFSDDIQIRLEPDPLIYLLDSLTLFVAIFLCMLYFMRIQRENHAVILSQKLELEKINVNKDKLISILSHDIKGPINSIQNLISANEEKYLTEDEMNELLLKIKLEFSKQFQFIDNLLQWSQNQLNDINVVKTVIKPTELIRSCVQQFQHLVNEKEISIEYDFLTDANIYIDKTHLQIAFRNILNNAIKFSPQKGSITIRCYQVERQYVIQVEDHGEGFSEEVINAFHRGDMIIGSKIGTRRETGNGLGLLLSRELLIKNSSRLKLSNVPKEGARVEISIPIGEY